MSEIVKVFSHDYDNMVKIDVVCTYKCNYNCLYCFNMKTIEKRTLQELDLMKVMQFAMLIHNSTGKRVVLSLIGGEPTLHSQLMQLCNAAKASVGVVEVILFTNFSKDVSFFKKLLEFDVKLLLTYHHGSERRKEEFTAKLAELKSFGLDSKIDTLNVMLLHDSFGECLEMYDFLYSSYGSKVRCNLIDDCDKDDIHFTRQMNYTSEQLKAYDDRCSSSGLLNDNIISYDDGYEVEVNDYWIKNCAELNFNKWMCNAGKDFFSVALDGSIYPCSMMKRKKVGSIYDLSSLKIGKTICSTSSCPCEYGIPKERVFR